MSDLVSKQVTTKYFKILDVVLTIYAGNRRGADIKLVSRHDGSVEYVGYFMHTKKAVERFDGFTCDEHAVNWAYYRD